MGASLKQKTVSGVTWTAIDKVGNYGIQFIISIIIARLLDPSDYGVIALVMVFVAILAVFVNSGFSQAIIQKKDITPQEISTVFFFNLAMSVSLYGLLYLSSPLIAHLFDMPTLTPILRVLGSVLIINSLSIVQIAILTKALRFKQQAVVHLAALFFSGAVGLSMAFSGYGVWALVGQSLVNAAAQTVAYWLTNRWRPLLHFALRDIARLWGFSSKLLVSSLIDTLYRHLQTILIGKFYSARDLGFYTQGHRFPDLVAMNATGIVQRVSFPVLATIQEDNVRLRIAYKRIIDSVVFFVFPALLLMSAVARPLIEVLLTAKWLPAVPYLQVLALASMLYPLHAINMNICMVKGRSDIFLKLEIIKKTIGLTLTLAAIPFGVMMLVYAVLVNSVIALYFNMKFNGDLIGYSWTAQLKDIFPTFTIAAIAAGCAWGAGFLPIPSTLLLLVVQAAVGGAIYLFLCRIFKLPAYAEVLAIVRERLGKMR